MNKKAMSQAMYIVISLTVMLIVALIVINIVNSGLTTGGEKLITTITDTTIPEIPTT